MDVLYDTVGVLIVLITLMIVISASNNFYSVKAQNLTTYYM